jgi:hypothetical protein
MRTRRSRGRLPTFPGVCLIHFCLTPSVHRPPPHEARGHGPSPHEARGDRTWNVDPSQGFCIQVCGLTGLSAYRNVGLQECGWHTVVYGRSVHALCTAKPWPIVLRFGNTGHDPWQSSSEWHHTFVTQHLDAFSTRGPRTPVFRLPFREAILGPDAGATIF